jgi:hypothetical protein
MKKILLHTALSLQLFALVIGGYLLSQEQYFTGLLNILVNAVFIPTTIRSLQKID